MKTLLLLTIAASSVMGAYAQSGNKFTLNGTIAGQNSGTIYLVYSGKGEARITDSAVVKNGSFSFNGEISEPTMGFLSADIRNQRSNEKSSLQLFLEPSVMQVALKKDAFDEAKITGSKAQAELEEMTKAKAGIRKEMEPALKKLSEASNRYNDAVKRKAPEDSIKLLKEASNDLREGLAPYNRRMAALDMQFFDKHPNSYATAYYLRFYVSSLPLDSLQLFYDRMNPELKKSAFGKNLGDEIAKYRAGSPGSTAGLFSAKDINGQMLNLADYRGKYVLLDFWASWCVPCRRGNPHLKTLYTKYKNVGNGIEFIGISDDDSNHDAWRKAVEKDDLPWRHVLRGLNMELRMKNLPNPQDISEKYGTHTLPTKILIDPTGKIIGRYGSEEEALDKKLKEIFGV